MIAHTTRATTTRTVPGTGRSGPRANEGSRRCVRAHHEGRELDDDDSLSQRRQVLLSLSLVASSLVPVGFSHADEAPVTPAEPSASASGARPAPAAGGAGKVGYLEISVDRKPFGRIEIEVFSDPTTRVGEARFLDLCREIQGVGYKRAKINRLMDTHVQSLALTNLSYTADGRTAITGGLTAELLEEELARSTRKHDVAGLVSLNVLPKKDMETKDMLKAIDGEFVNVTQTFGNLPNGTEFSITTGPAPDLDGINLIVGRVVSGMDVVERLQKLPKVKNNESSPFFKVGKATKDRRADVAELGFDRPFSTVIVAQSGVM